jgi:hypothetical protein
MSLLRRSRFQPSRRLSRRRQLLNIARNLWVLRGELWSIVRRKKPERDAGVALRCIACKHEITKPCIRGRTKHLVKWPAGVPGFEEGAYVEVRRQKPHGGQFEKDYDLTELKP